MTSHKCPKCHSLSAIKGYCLLCGYRDHDDDLIETPHPVIKQSSGVLTKSRQYASINTN